MAIDHGKHDYGIVLPHHLRKTLTVYDNVDDTEDIDCVRPRE